nr:hypothetical protein [Tanacetum cinerariifolium]
MWLSTVWVVMKFGVRAELALKTIALKSGALRHDIHYWLCKDTSRDEARAVALKTVELDAALAGRVFQYREVQGHEIERPYTYRPSHLGNRGGAMAWLPEASAKYRNYNLNEGRGSKKYVTKEVAMEELLEIKSTNWTTSHPKDSRQERSLWKKPIVQYIPASYIGLEFDANIKRVKVICLSQLFSKRSTNAIIVWEFGYLSSLFIACNTSAEIIESFQLATWGR